MEEVGDRGVFESLRARLGADVGSGRGAGREREGRRLGFVELSEVAVRGVRWLWHPYVPLGKLTLLDGDPGVGKSYLSLALAAAVTRGEELPGGATPEPGNVLLLCGEDAVEDTVKPRLLSLGVFEKRVRVVTGVIGERRETALMLSPEGLGLLSEQMAEYRPALVIVDPLVAYLGSHVDMHRANEVRGVLRPLAAMAQRHGAAILALRHLTKAPGAALYRGQGSIDFAAAARSILLVVRDPNDAERRIMVPTKSSLAAMGPGLVFRLDPEGEEVLRWEGTARLEPDRLLEGPVGVARSRELEEATAFLRDALAGGAVAARDVIREAKGAGIALRTLERAKALAGVRSVFRRDADGRRWEWELVRDRQDRQSGGLCEDSIFRAGTGDGVRPPRPPRFGYGDRGEEGW
jgi:hypothetical protein